MPINRKFFFDHARDVLFRGTMKQKQVEGLEFFINFWEKDNGNTLKDHRWLAYMLGTAHHETGMTMQPIEEWGKGKSHTYGQADPVTGKAYYGRGYVQLTWKTNYQKMGDLLGLDLVNQPELALDPDIAARITESGMVGGLFTGKKLGNYFNDTTEDWVNARRIINRLDKAENIAHYARDYYSCIGLIVT